MIDNTDPGATMRNALDIALNHGNRAGGPEFDGAAYEPKLDWRRLVEILRVYDCMKDGQWRAFSDIEGATGDPQASISAQLRNLRKPKFGGHQVEKKRIGLKTQGCGCID